MTWSATVPIAAALLGVGLITLLLDRAAWRRTAGMALALAGIALLCVAQARDRNEPAGMILPWLLAGVWVLVVALAPREQESDPSSEDSEPS